MTLLQRQFGKLEKDPRKWANNYKAMRSKLAQARALHRDRAKEVREMFEAVVASADRVKGFVLMDARLGRPRPHHPLC